MHQECFFQWFYLHQTKVGWGLPGLHRISVASYAICSKIAEKQTTLPTKRQSSVQTSFARVQDSFDLLESQL